MEIKYFNINNINTVEELKKEYRKLSMKYHPDVSGYDSNDIMAIINNEYEYLFANIETIADNKAGHNVNDNYRTIIDELIKYSDITVDLIGTWLWVSGNTYPIRQHLNKLGFRFQKSSKKWYLGEFTSKRKRKRSLSWNDKIKKFGKETLLKNNKNKNPLLTD